MKTLICIFVCLVSQISLAQNVNNTGCISGDCKDGLGLYVWPSGEIYKGYFKNGERHGKGIFVNKNGYKTYGFWENNIINGKSKTINRNGRTFYCTYVKGIKHGQSIIFDKEGIALSEQKWDHGKMTENNRIAQYDNEHKSYANNQSISGRNSNSRKHGSDNGINDHNSRYRNKDDSAALQEEDEEAHPEYPMVYYENFFFSREDGSFFSNKVKSYLTDDNFMIIESVEEVKTNGSYKIAIKNEILTETEWQAIYDTENDEESVIDINNRIKPKSI